MAYPETTLVNPAWRPCSGRRTIHGILFKSYSSGITRYTQVSEDGMIRLWANFTHTGYHCEVFGHGTIPAQSKRQAKRFTTEENAVAAALKIMRKAINA